ncbi:MAG: DMT family transporter [Coriobacteriales bacterium]|jgi:drug/metabolite transporter (DMT)-like permease
MSTMTERSSKRIIGIVCALIGGALWGFSGSCAQLVFQVYHLDPLWVMAARAGIAGVVMVFFLFYKGKSVLDVFHNKRDTISLLVYVVLGLAFMQLTYLMAIDSSNAGTATVLMYIGPVLVVLYVCIRSRKKPNWREIVSLVFVVMGTFLLATHGDISQMVITPAGLFWGLMAAVAMVFYTVLPQHLIARYGNATIISWALIICGVIMCAWQRPWENIPQMGADGWIALVLGLTLIGTILAFYLYYQGVKFVGPSDTSVLASVETVSATLLSALWLGTPFELIDIAGMVLIVLTVPLLGLHRENREKART